MKKISLLLVVLLLFTLTSCSKVNIYKEAELDTYFDELYTSTTNPGKYVAVDLRSNASYEKGHISQMQGFDLKAASASDLVSWLTSNYGSKYKVYIYADFDISDVVNSLKKHYKTISVITMNEKDFMSKAESIFRIDQGPYDCHCK